MSVDYFFHCFECALYDDDLAQSLLAFLELP